eukprot:2757728-Rhodomonas_salina.2
MSKLDVEITKSCRQLVDAGFPPPQTHPSPPCPVLTTCVVLPEFEHYDLSEHLMNIKVTGRFHLPMRYPDLTCLPVKPVDPLLHPVQVPRSR